MQRAGKFSIILHILLIDLHMKLMLRSLRIALLGLIIGASLRRLQNQMLLARINATYAEDSEPSEVALRRMWRRTHRRLVEGEW